MKRGANSQRRLRSAAAAALFTMLSAATGYAGSSAPASVANSPVCDPSVHPKIMKITPDTVKPGDKITIKGKNFGNKQCFHNVTFGSATATFTYVNDTTLEATVPSSKTGLMPVHIMTEGGTSESVILVQAK